MRYTKFHFTNFRGIRETSVDLIRNPNAKINVLVGLNESGKTTVLEAIYHFLSNPNLLKAAPSETRRTASDYQAMLPISKRALFNGKVVIKAWVEMQPGDWFRIDSFMKETFGFAATNPVQRFSIEHTVFFEDSRHKETKNIWNIWFEGRPKGRGNRKWITLADNDWLKVANYAQSLLPQIVYFPAALLNFPDRIILEDPSEERAEGAEPKNEFYCGVLEDILRAIDPTLQLQSHLIDRAKNRSSINSQNLQALLQKIEQHLRATVFSEWEKIFANTPKDTDFRVSVSEQNGQLGFEVKIATRDGLFSINERSAGFRWFFAFILLTRYRLNRKGEVLFLFDEPAANLHPNAQTQLLKSFSLLAKEASIIYSTHSHYLINPLWLESTHIVRNAGSGEMISIDMQSPMSAEIAVTPYRAFVGSHPDQYFYYRPIQEALDYSPSPLEFPSSVILVEGKTDFFLLKYINSQLNIDSETLQLFPGGGAGSLDPLISLLHGWGKNFVVLLDGDADGNRQKVRYSEKFEQIVAGRLFCLGDVDSTWDSYQIEKLLDPADIQHIAQDRFPDTKTSKKVLHKAIQELIAMNRPLKLSSKATSNFKKLVIFLKQQLSRY